MRVRFRCPWDKQVVLEGELKWVSQTHDWCAVKVPRYIYPFQLNYSKTRPAPY
jgi:hypothetical protein